MVQKSPLKGFRFSDSVAHPPSYSLVTPAHPPLLLFHHITPNISSISHITLPIYVHSLVFKTYAPLSTFWVFIIVPFTIWSYTISNSVVAIQLKSNNIHTRANKNTCMLSLVINICIYQLYYQKKKELFFLLYNCFSNCIMPDQKNNKKYSNVFLALQFIFWY